MGGEASPSSCDLTLREAQIELIFRLSLSTQHRAEVERVLQMPTLLQCFLTVCDKDPQRGAELISSYASWRSAHSALLADPPPFDALPLRSPPLAVEVIETGTCAIALVRDCIKLGELIDAHGLVGVLNAHVHALERLLEQSSAARHGGIHVVQDLREMSTAFVVRMVDPQHLATQARAARFLLGAFPTKWPAVFIVDAPKAFGVLWRAAKAFLPTALADSVQFLQRPLAHAQLESFYGRPVLPVLPMTPGTQT